MVSLVFFYILQLPPTLISNSEKLTHPNGQWTPANNYQVSRLPPQFCGAGLSEF